MSSNVTPVSVAGITDSLIRFSYSLSLVTCFESSFVSNVSFPRLLSWKIFNPRDKLVEDKMSLPFLYSGSLLFIKW
uniref:Uncharacterized protein n=1 Tax=Arundo donax TaxID=35708 RepID=A0A0A9CXF2_ARUDO